MMIKSRTWSLESTLHKRVDLMRVTQAEPQIDFLAGTPDDAQWVSP